MDKKLNLDGCWIVSVPHPKYGYSFAVYVNYHSCEEDIIDMSRQNGLFEEDEDSEIAIAEQMSEYEYDKYWKDQIQILAY